jgi:sulfur relay (sulfurtransferase) complex TusBCD TusD component (DsrE family)
MSYLERYEDILTKALHKETCGIVAKLPTAELMSLRRATNAAALRLCVAAAAAQGYTAKEAEILIGTAGASIRNAAEEILQANGDFRKGLGL